MQKKKFNKPFAKRSFGQNFLVDEHYISKIISALKLRENETIIEIGAGRGALTEKMIESGAKVIAIELEKDMIEVLREKFSSNSNFQLIESDALKVDFAALQNTHFPHQKIKLAANLPYYISTAILQKLIEQRDVFSELVLMFQREVVERIMAAVGNSERGFLTVLVENYLESERLFEVPPTAFRPIPKVWSAVALLKPKEKAGIEDEKLFREIISSAFSQKRKTILNNLKNIRQISNFDWQNVLKNAEIEPLRRAESLTTEEWKRLYSEIEKIKRSRKSE